MNSQARLVAAAVVAAALWTTGCSGGSDKKTDPPPPPPRTLSGTVTYDKVPTSPNGLDYAATVAKPIRGATVELMNGSTVIATTTSSNTGAYSFSWPASGPATVRIRVKALTTTPVIRVEDNTAGDALHGMVSPDVNSDTTPTLNLHAPSGWGGTSYTGTRVAAPFAILDATYSAAQTFLAERSVPFPDLKVNWSPNNRSETGDKALGQIGTSHWDGTELYILGKADADTDEYDDHIIVHEWGHYFESKVSRADSPGDTHSFGDFKDPRLSWGEGWATALGAIVFYPDDVYADTQGAQQATAGIYYSIEDNGAEDSNPGWFSEASMVHFFYDLWDPASAETFDHVSVSVGALYDVMTGFQKNTDSFTTMFSFVTGLVTANPSLAAPISELLAYRGVADSVQNEWALGESHDGGITGAVPVYRLLVANDPVTTVSFTADTPIMNTLGQNRYAVFEGDGTSVSLAAANAADKPVALQVFVKGVRKAAAESGVGTPAQITNFSTTAGTIYTVIITGGDTTPGSYTANVVLTSP